MRILYIDIDTLRPDHLGCYGYHRNTSPNIDKIAEKGVIFTNCYASDVPCLPSRASFFSGRFGIHTGIVGHGGTAADMRLTGKDRDFTDKYLNNGWIGRMRLAKYYTASISPFAERHSAYWFCAGWNEIYNPGKRGNEKADDILPYSIKWLNDNGQRDNWLLHLNLWDPHTPYRTPLSFEPSFENDHPPSWITNKIIEQHRKSYGPRSACDLGGFGKSYFSRSYERIHKLREIKNIEDYTEWINAYDVGIRYADAFIGRIIDLLKNLKVFEETVIIISSDHGENQGELNIYGDHHTACHITSRVPMIINWPGKKWKKQYNSLIYTTDVAATITECVGQRVPDFWDGKSFFKEIENNHEFGRKYLVLSQNAWSCQRTVRFDNWTLIRTYHTGLKNFPEIMLFDYENDFHMTNDLANEKPEIVAKGLDRLDEWHNQMMKTSKSNIDPLETVINENGPFHTKGQLEDYLKWLKKSGRENLITNILARNEPY
ncbi:MAG: sulfatase-like hydrolase/transferase [Candidatus Hodarchaeota archaeon]